jgi:hypothetical protein
MRPPRSTYVRTVKISVLRRMSPHERAVHLLYRPKAAKSPTNLLCDPRTVDARACQWGLCRTTVRQQPLIPSVEHLGLGRSQFHSQSSNRRRMPAMKEAVRESLACRRLHAIEDGRHPSTVHSAQAPQTNEIARELTLPFLSAEPIVGRFERLDGLHEACRHAALLSGADRHPPRPAGPIPPRRSRIPARVMWRSRSLVSGAPCPTLKSLLLHSGHTRYLFESFKESARSRSAILRARSPPSASLSNARR